MFNNYPDVVSVADIQSMLNIGRSYAYMLVQEGSIRSIRMGRKYIIPKQSVINYLTLPVNHDIMSEHSRLVISKEDSN